jgi:DNA-binding MarR family transcriptional regulator
LSKTANDRQYSILQLLKEGPRRESELCRQYMAANRSDNLNDERFYDYVLGLLDSLEMKGWVQRVRSYGNNVWFVLTEEGFQEMLRSRDPKKLRRMQQSKLRRALLTSIRIEGRSLDLRDISNYTRGLLEWLEDSRQRIADLTRVLPAKDVVAVKTQVLATLMAENRMPNRRTEERTRSIERLTRELPPDNLRRAEKLAGRRLLEYHRRSGIALTDDGLPVVYGKCFFCGADIVVKEAAEDAELLSRYGGKKGEMVCCGCYSNLKWMEKHFGGEQVGKSVQP